jgi:hypothetical protein
VSAGQLRHSAQAGVDWFVRNQKPDGTWLYLYDARDDTEPAEYNAVRHTGAVMGLYRAASLGLPGAMRSADRGTGWALDRLLRRDGWAAVDWGGQVETGSTALLVAGLVLRREATGDTRHDAVLRRLGRFLVEQTTRTGAVLATYDVARGAPTPGEYSKYFTGEAYWALTLLHRTFPREGWGATAKRIGAYLATSRDDVEGHWPPIADHWAAYGLAETAQFPERGRPPLTGQEVAYARRQAELFGGQVRWVSQRFGPWGALVRGGQVPRGGGYGVTSEGLTGLWLAARDDRGWRIYAGRSPSAPPASPGWPCGRSRTPATPRTPRIPAAWRARGSATARPGWTTSSTRSSGCSEPWRSSGPARDRPRATTRHRAGSGRSRSCWR